MALMLSTKGADLTAWRAAENFVATYRQTLLERAASGRCGDVEAVFDDTIAALKAATDGHQNLLRALELRIEELSKAPSAPDMKAMTCGFYNDLYRHFELFRSAPVFYSLSMAFLRRASAVIVKKTAEQLGVLAEELPEIALIAVGPAGRLEYSPFCPLQILCVHGEVAPAQHEAFNLFSNALHAGFNAAGFITDKEVTPRNPRWRGTITKWRRHCEDALQSCTEEYLIDLSRLVDQCTLYSSGIIDQELKHASGAALKGNRPAQRSLVDRMTSLSNGLGIMGGLKLEWIGSERGLFNLLGHGLLPFSAALSALALIRDIQEPANCGRIRDLLERRELDVELAEKMLATWHSLNNIRLHREQFFQIDTFTDESHFLDPDKLTFAELHSLKESLEAVASIQRHVEIIFSGMEE